MAPDMPRPDQLDAAVLDPALPPDRIRELARAAAAAGVAGVRVHGGALESLGPGEWGRVRLGAVAGWPLGKQHVLVKAAEARLAVAHGAVDVAVVADPAAAAEPGGMRLLGELAAMREAVAAPMQLTVVLSPGHDDGAPELAARAGADAVGLRTADPAEVAALAGRLRAAGAGGVGIIAMPPEDGPEGMAGETADAAALLAAGAHVVQVPVDRLA
ncbi:hypothetical protein [Corynebacterium sp.]|uniref:hypothetical protein n=1 Tax=Corynebacterium sp. TaxID=1720 RepID=UPI0026DB2876|nr:hypothetical protein [Corynebacterium sp.]MDO4609889.1 hypothetical protein [Corynebacterium sp.]